MINDKTGFVVLRKFNRKASSQTINAIRELKDEGAERIILDLRGNPGGLLSEAVNVTNIFVPKGQLVVTTKSKVKKFNKTYYTKNDPLDTKIPVVVLIDGSSASASEIVSGALQDLDRAVIVGARSFGKGLVQRPKKLTYGTQIKVTISRYYTPSGRCIQSLDYWNRDTDGNAVRVKKEQYNEFKTKNGRPVFDGGGVKPDVEMDITKNSAITNAILRKDYVFDFATAYHYKNSISDLNSFKLTSSDFSKFKSYLKKNDFSFETKTEKVLKKAFETAENEDINAQISKEYQNLISKIETTKAAAIDNNKDQLLSLLTDEIVKRYFYREGLYTYYTQNNPEIKKATEILSNNSMYQNYLE